MNQLSYDVKSEKINSCGFVSRDLLDHGVQDTIKMLKAHV